MKHQLQSLLEGQCFPVDPTRIKHEGYDRLGTFEETQARGMILSEGAGQ